MQSIYDLTTADLTKALQETLLSVIAGIDRHAMELDPQQTSSLQNEVRAIQRKLRTGMTVPVLASAAKEIDALLARQQAFASTFVSQKQTFIQELLGTLSQLATSAATSNEAESSLLTRFSGEFQAVLESGSEEEIRRTLAKRVSEFRNAVGQRRTENEQTLGQLRTKLEELQSRLEVAEKLASSDALTGLANRRKGEAQLMDLVANARGPFSVLLADLDGFKKINDTLGHGPGDQILRVIAKKLERQVRPEDCVCRWGGDEFLILMRCDGQTVRSRVKDIQREIAGRYTVVVIGRQVPVTVGLSIGVAEYRPGATIDELLTAADEDLYRQKKSR